MSHIKQIISVLLIFGMLAFCGCSGSIDIENTHSTVSSLCLSQDYVIVLSAKADDTAVQAANLLQTTLDFKLRTFKPKIVTQDPGSKAIVLSVDSAMTEGQYALTLNGTSLHISAGESHTLLYAVKLLRQTLLDSEDPTCVTNAMCQSLSGTVAVKNLPFTFLTQNMLFKDAEGSNTIGDRAPRFEALVREYLPDIIAVQENCAEWIFYYNKRLGDTYFQVNRDSLAILLRADRFELVDNGYFWMSPTPGVMSQFEGDSGARACCWAIVKDLVTSQELFICNTHPDWNNDESRARQLEVMYQQIAPYTAKYPSIVCGDFNTAIDSPVYTRICELYTDSRTSASQNLSAVEYTYHNFLQDMSKVKLIDHIFHTPQLKANLHSILSDDYGGFVSDHYGVMTEFCFDK